MKESPRRSYEVGKTEVEAFDAKVKSLLDPDSAPRHTGADFHQTTYIRGTETIRVSHSDYGKASKPFVRVTTPIESKSKSPLSEQRTYTGELGEHVASMHYGFEIVTPNEHGKTVPVGCRSAEDMHQDRVHGLYEVSVPEHAELLKILETLGPQDMLDE